MTNHTFSEFYRVEIIVDIVVSAKVGDSIVDVVTEALLFVLELGAAGRRADWVRLKLDISADLEIIDDPFMVERVLGVSEMLGGGDHVWIELGSEVIIGVLRWVMPLSLRFFGSHLEFVTESTFRDLKGVMVFEDFVVNTQVWHWIINIIT